MSYDEYQYYDYDDYEKLNAERAKKQMDLVRKWHALKEKGNVEATKKALKAIVKHREEDEKFKERSKESHYHWY